MDPNAHDTLYASVYSVGDENIFKSVDRGATWNPVSSGFPTHGVIFSLTIDPSASNTIYAGASDGVFKSSDGGVHWTSINSNVSYVHSLAIDPSSLETLYAGAYWDGVFKTPDRGSTWQQSGANYGNGSGPASTLTKLSGDNQVGEVNHFLKYSLVVLVTNAAGIPVAGTAVDFSVTTGNGNLSVSQSVTDSQGIAMTKLKLGEGLGENIVTVTSDSLQGSPATFVAIANRRMRSQVTSQ